MIKVLRREVNHVYSLTLCTNMLWLLTNSMYGTDKGESTKKEHVARASVPNSSIEWL